MTIERAKSFVIDLNTILIVFGIIGGIVAAALFFVASGQNYQAIVNRIEAVEKWKVDHEQVAKDRRGEIEGTVGRISALVTGLDERLDTAEAGSNRQADRITAAEARAGELSQTLRDLQVSIARQGDVQAEQGGDLKVILAWIEEQRRAQGVRR